LAGVSLEEDSRNVVGADLDGDGKVDLVLTTAAVWPRLSRLYRCIEIKCRTQDIGSGSRFHQEGQWKFACGSKGCD
jgi:hypothetical protein